MAFGVIISCYELIAGPVAKRIKMIPVICFCIVVIVFLIVRRPWK